MKLQFVTAEMNAVERGARFVFFLFISIEFSVERNNKSELMASEFT